MFMASLAVHLLFKISLWIIYIFTMDVSKNALQVYRCGFHIFLNMTGPPKHRDCPTLNSLWGLMCGRQEKIDFFYHPHYRTHFCGMSAYATLKILGFSLQMPYYLLMLKANLSYCCELYL